MNREDRTLLYRMLNIPSFQARYLHHVKVIRDDWLDWNKIGPVFQTFHDLINAEVKQDRKRLYSYDAFVNSLENKKVANASSGAARSTSSIRSFIEARRKTLMEHPALKGAWPGDSEFGNRRHIGAD